VPEGIEPSGLEAFDELIDSFMLERASVCHEFALDISHRHTIGCVLVMKHMKDNHPDLEYGTRAQWEEESAFCLRHEREIFKRFLLEKMDLDKATRLLQLLREINS
jgi:hypothetical protein